MWNGDVVDDDRWDVALMFCSCGVSVCCWCCWWLVVVAVVVLVCVVVRFVMVV